MLGLLDLTDGRGVVDLGEIDIMRAETGLVPQLCGRAPADVVVEVAAVPASAVREDRRPDADGAPAGGAICSTQHSSGRAIAHRGAHGQGEWPDDLTGGEHLVDRERSAVERMLVVDGVAMVLGADRGEHP